MISGKKIIILGFGKEGVSAANYLGLNNKIIIFDEKSRKQISEEFFKNLKIKNSTVIFEKLNPGDFNFDYIVRSPGFKYHSPIIDSLVANGAKLTSPTKIFFDDCPAPIIGITGTKGKGTTSTLIYEILKADQRDVYLAGNIGLPALDILPKLSKNSFAVLELSSFQLFDLHKSPHIAVVLMITSEHLDWHKDTKEYRSAKESIVKYQNKSDFAIINQDFEASCAFAEKTKGKVYFFSTMQKTNGLHLVDNKIISEVSQRETIASTKDVLLVGKHNLQNILAASSVAKILRIENDTIKKVLATFKGLKHRLELIAEIDGTAYYNDSFSTTPETTIAAIEAFSRPKILILGGSTKHSSFEELAKTIVNNTTIKTLILIGHEAKRIKNALSNEGSFHGKIREGAQSMHDIISQAKEQTTAGDVVILSPACASFDMFKNYIDRGEQFAQEVLNLKNGK